MKSKYSQIEPGLQNLKQFIKLYYVHSSEDDSLIERTTYFPNFTATLNIYQDSKVTWDSYSRTHEEENTGQFLKLLVGKIDKSREVIQKGKFNKLSIVFHPLGLNNFVDYPLSNIIEDHFAFFDSFGESFDRILHKVFETDDLVLKRDMLDEYFSSIHVGFVEDHMTFAVNKILNADENISIQSIANELGISRKTLYRLFKTHLSMSPTEYSGIVKFRRALNMFFQNKDRMNLVDISYNANFYDQSDLNLHFKQKTGLTPKRLFAEIQTIANELHWRVDHVPDLQENN